MRHVRLAVLVTAVLTTPALAQQSGGAGAGQGGVRSPNPQMQAALKKYQPVLDLGTTVSLLADVDKDKKTTLTKAQAAKLLPILQDLAKRADLKPADAQKILSNIEDGILTDAQLTKVDDLVLAREEARRERMAKAQASGGTGGAGGARLPFVPGGQFGGQRRQGTQGSQNGQGGRGPGGPGGMFAAIQNGTPYNPFKSDRQAKGLQDLIAVLRKK
ncbi:hypothetical protein [Deinococcus pimensis]|uniref:hypothetical protein n=1 Tax=Deinococcus pimensis TaxID=309888 RepID=UPI0004801AD0|nr:hypothetical protein [Deinococcus pimensis]